MGQDLVIPKNFGTLSTHFADTSFSDDLAGGIVGGFAVLGYRGRVFRLKHKGDEIALTDEAGNPLPSVELIILKSANHLSKLFYAGGYQEGSSGVRPDCFSSNGVQPDLSVLEPVSPVCASCPNNAFGSRVTEAGKASKACSDHKRLVVVPLEDPENEFYGGPMLLRVPAASLGDLSTFSQKLKQMGWPYYAIAVRVRFDIDAEYPKLLFSPLRALNEDEAAMVVALREDPRVARVLNEEPEAVAATPESNNGGFEQPTPPAAPAPAPAPRPAPRPAPAAATAAVRPAAPKAATPPAPAPVAAQPAPRPATPPARPAPRPAAAPPAPVKAGGFARPANPQQPAPTAGAKPAGFARPGTINAAMATPAARPPTVRPVARAAPAPQPAQEEAPQYEEDTGGAPPELDAELDALLT